MAQVNVKIKDNAEVEKKIQQTAKKLNKKYSKKRWVNEKRLLKEQTPLQKCLSIFANILFWSALIICCLLCLVTVVSRVQKRPATFIGYNYMQITTESMEASGFFVGDNIAVRSVYTDSLKPGDKIAFYVYPNSYNQYYKVKRTKLNQFSDGIEYKLNIQGMFNYDNKQVKSAIQANSSIVFHEIVAVYEDENGERWFKTKGSSRVTEDFWSINEKMVIGVYDAGFISRTMNGLLHFLTTNKGLITIIYLPQLLIFAYAVGLAIKNVQLAFLELDVVEEKRKLTDKICVNNDIGFNMARKTKLKVLAQAEDDEKLEYMALLWHKGTAPASIQKYLMRKSILLRQMKKKLELNRQCQIKLAQGETPTSVAQYYYAEKVKIEQDLARYQQLLKNVHNKYKTAIAVNKSNENKSSQPLTANIQNTSNKQFNNVKNSNQPIIKPQVSKNNIVQPQINEQVQQKPIPNNKVRNILRRDSSTKKIDTPKTRRNSRK